MGMSNEPSNYTITRQASDLSEMLLADANHLAAALLNGDRTKAHRLVDAIIDNKRLLEDLGR